MYSPLDSAETSLDVLQHHHLSLHQYSSIIDNHIHIISTSSPHQVHIKRNQLLKFCVSSTYNILQPAPASCTLHGPEQLQTLENSAPAKEIAEEFTLPWHEPAWKTHPNNAPLATHVTCRITVSKATLSKTKKGIPAWRF